MEGPFLHGTLVMSKALTPGVNPGTPTQTTNLIRVKASEHNPSCTGEKSY